jgi:serine/threonine-protein kinase
VPRRLAQAIDRCLAKDPAERPEGTAAFADLLSHALEQRRELPVALRAFVKHDARLDGSGVLVYPFALMVAAPLSAFLAGSIPVGFATLGAGLSVVPLGVLLNRARRLLRTGFDHSDIGVAFKAEIERTREERAFGVGHGPSTLERVLKMLSAIGLGLAVVTFPEFVGAVTPAFAVGMTLGLVCGIGALIQVQRRRDVDAEFWGRFWTGRAGCWLFKIARALTPTKALPAPLTHRPTELSIGMAAEQLYETLPKETRRQLRDLPDVVHRLEDDAQRTRRRLEELQDALGGAKTHSADPTIGARHDRIFADLTAERELVQQRLADAVAALETIRMNLLRLHAGTGSVHSLTTDLGLAREVAKGIDLLLQGQREVEEELGR